MYLFYLDKILLPVTPSSLTITTKNKNTTINLINEGEIVIPKTQGLRVIKFDAMLPYNEYPFAVYNGGFRNADYFINKLNKLGKRKKPFKFIVTRKTKGGEKFKSTNIKVVFDGDIQYKEDANNGMDIMCSISLIEYKNYGLKEYPIVFNNNTSSNIIIQSEALRSTENSPLPTQSLKYIVQDGDTLWKLAKYYYNNGAKYTIIYEANKDKIINLNLIYSGQEIIIPCIN